MSELHHLAWEKTVVCKKLTEWQESNFVVVVVFPPSVKFFKPINFIVRRSLFLNLNFCINWVPNFQCMPVLSIIVSVYIQYMPVHICNTCIEESKKLIVGNKDLCHKNTTYFQKKIARNWEITVTFMFGLLDTFFFFFSISDISAIIHKVMKYFCFGQVCDFWSYRDLDLWLPKSNQIFFLSFFGPSKIPLRHS